MNNKTIQSLLYFFTSLFLVKVIFGSVSGSKSLLISGAFEVFGIFITILSFMRLQLHENAHKIPKFGEEEFNLEKLEFIIAAGVSVLIAVTTSVLLYFIVHVTFFHALHPDGLIGGTISAMVAWVNYYVLRRWKQGVTGHVKSDIERILFLIHYNFVFATMTAGAVFLSYEGVLIIDYVLAIVMTVFILAYGVFLLYDAAQGLMDVSVDASTLESITQHIQSANPNLAVKTLKARRVGVTVEIIAMLGLPPETELTETGKILGVIHRSLADGLTVPHRLHIGFHHP